MTAWFGHLGQMLLKVHLMKRETLFFSSFPLSAAKTRDFLDGAALINGLSCNLERGRGCSKPPRVSEEGGVRRDHLAQHIWLNKRPSAHVMGWVEEENRYSMVRHGSDRILDSFRKLLQTVISVRERNADFTYHTMA